jgi:hypothetical protein
MNGDRDRPRTNGAKLAERCACDLPDTILREFGRFSEANEEQLRNTETSNGVKEASFREFSAEAFLLK